MSVASIWVVRISSAPIRVEFLTLVSSLTDTFYITQDLKPTHLNICKHVVELSYKNDNISILRR